MSTHCARCYLHRDRSSSGRTNREHWHTFQAFRESFGLPRGTMRDSVEAILWGKTGVLTSSPRPSPCPSEGLSLGRRNRGRGPTHIGWYLRHNIPRAGASTWFCNSQLTNMSEQDERQNRTRSGGSYVPGYSRGYLHPRLLSESVVQRSEDWLTIHPWFRCERCKERKIKCDRQLPTCHRCLRSNVCCEYAGRRKPGFPAGHRQLLEAKICTSLRFVPTRIR